MKATATDPVQARAGRTAQLSNAPRTPALSPGSVLSPAGVLMCRAVTACRPRVVDISARGFSA